MQTQPVGGGGSNALPVGYQLGEYTIAAALGEGGFGITYRARDTKLGVDVAIKEYFPSVYATRTESSTIVARAGSDAESYQWGLTEFLKEAQVLARFKHAHIVRVLRFLEANGTAYTIMEYEEGETLTSYLRKHGGLLTEPKLLQLFLPILNGLQAVHDAGLLHLDIKPDNIYLRTNEQPILIDFGSSRQMRGDTGEKITLTPGYCALEQYPGHGDVSAASDVYGMGATLYRCITGKNPVDARERHRLFGRTHMDPLQSATSFERPIYSPRIRDCVDRALKLTAAERPPSAYALQQGLMGKDMTKLGARAPISPYRPGTGYVGVMLPAEKRKIFRRRYTLFEKTVAIAVFIATLVVITPRIMIDSGLVNDFEVYEWVDDTKAEIVGRARDARDWINENIFGVTPRPKVAHTAPPPRKAAASPATPTAVAPKQPFGDDKQPFIEIAVTEQAPRALAFLKHGAVLAIATADGLVRLWDVPTGKLQLTLPTRVLQAGALGVFPSSQWLAAMDRDETIVVFDPLGNQESTLRNDPPHPIVAISVSANARLLAELAEDGMLTVWELSQKRPLQKWSVGKTALPLIAFAPDERTLVTADRKGELTVWDGVTAKRVALLQAHQRALTALAFSADGRWLASADAAGELRIWSVPPPNQDWPASRVVADTPATLNSLSFSPDGDWLIATGSVGSVYVWNVESGALAHRITTDRRALRALTLTRDGKWMAAVGDDNVVRVWK